MAELTRLRTPQEVAEGVAKSSRGSATAEQIMQGRNRPRGHHHYYGFCLTVQIWANQTVPMQTIEAASVAFALPPRVLETAVATINKDAEIEPFKIVNDIAAAVWPEHPYYRGGPGFG